jgi:hypothetical protein
MIRTALAGYGLQVQVVVMVFRAELAHVVVHIADRQIGLGAGRSHRFEEQKRCCAGCVLGERLVDSDADRFTGLEFALNEVFLQNLMGQCLCHVFNPLYCASMHPASLEERGRMPPQILFALFDFKYFMETGDFKDLVDLFTHVSQF